MGAWGRGGRLPPVNAPSSAGIRAGEPQPESPMRRARSLVLPLTLIAAVAAAPYFGPPRVTVREVTGAPPVPGAVLEVVAEHHTDEEHPQVTGRAIGQRGSERVSKPLILTLSGTKGRYGVTRQWEAGTAWVLVFTVRQGEHGEHGTAESLVKVDATGRVVGIQPASERNARGDTYPRAFTEREVETALAAVRGAR